MSNMIIDPTDKPLVDPAYNKFMAAPATKGELQSMIDHFARHLDELYATLDTQHIVLNLIAEEKLNITKAELLAYVEKKKQELADLAAKREEALKRAQEKSSEQSN